MKKKPLFTGSFGSQLQFGALSGKAWQILLQEGGKSGPLTSSTLGVSICLAPVAAHHYIIRDNRFSSSWPLVTFITLYYTEICIGRSVGASVTVIHLLPVCFVYRLTRH